MLVFIIIDSFIVSSVRFIVKIRHFVGIDTLKNIYYALVNSYIRYGLTSWGNASSETLKPLQAMINRIVRIMSFAPLGRVSAKPIFEHLNILDLKQTFTLETAKFIFKKKNNLLPLSTIAHHFDRPVTSSNRPQRRPNSILFIPIELCSEFAKKSIQIRQIEIWDDIPNAIRNSETLNAFKKLLKHHLIYR